MVDFLTTAGVNYHLEELIKQSNERLVLISPTYASAPGSGTFSKTRTG